MLNTRRFFEVLFIICLFIELIYYFSSENMVYLIYFILGIMLLILLFNLFCHMTIKHIEGYGEVSFPILEFFLIAINIITFILIKFML